MVRANDRIHYGPMVVFAYLHFTFPHYYHHADVSEGIDWTCLVQSVEYVSRIKSILSIVFHAIYGLVCIWLIRFFYDDCENMCTLFNFHHQIGWSNDPIAIVLGLRHVTMVCAVWLSIPFCITGPYCNRPDSGSNGGNKPRVNCVFINNSQYLHYTTSTFDKIMPSTSLSNGLSTRLYLHIVCW